MATAPNGNIPVCKPKMTGRQYTRRFSFNEFMLGLISRKMQLGKAGTAHNYKSTLNSFLRFMSGNNVKFSVLTPELIEEYEAWLIAANVKSNSISFYMRNLRAAYNHAVELGYTADRDPFRKAYTRIEKTTKRAVSLADIRRIKALDLSALPALELSRDIFMFLFYCRGMSFIDAAYLSDTNIIGNELIYRRHKTGQELRIGLNKYILQLLDKWQSGYCTGSYLLPILTGGHPAGSKFSRTEYESALRRTNKSLKHIARMANIRTSLTTYVSRHSWASIAKSKGIPTATISDALGHDSELTTQIYLTSLSTDTIDRANAIILREL
ncbi:MAG: site-specific integrase [Muribaculaceae bacterium]|nr:site-specific integrase [Muribaculaceae bacterium]